MAGGVEETKVNNVTLCFAFVSVGTAKAGLAGK